MSQRTTSLNEQPNDMQNLPEENLESQAPQSLEEEISMNRSLLQEMQEEMRKMEAEGKDIRKMWVLCRGMERYIRGLEEELRERSL